MNIVVSGKHIELSDSLKKYAQDKFGKLKNYFEHILRVDIVLSKQDAKAKEERQGCEVTVSANGIVLRATENSVDLYSAIDLCLEKMERQIKKYNEKMKNRKNNKKDHDMTHTIFSPTLVDDDDKETPPQIIKTKQFSMKPMFIDEAAMQLNVLDQDFVVFSNAKTDQVNVVYRMTDGNIGLIEPNYK